jgi:hypothetical protein
MAAPAPLTADCPVCGGLIGWNVTTAPSRAPAVLVTLDDLSARRHRGCGILPTAS